MVFDKNKNIFPTVDPLDRRFTQPDDSVQDAHVPAVTGTVYTMPKKFLNTGGAGDGASRKHTKLIVVLSSVFFIMLLALLGVIFFRSQFNSSVHNANTSNSSVANNSSVTSNQNTNRTNTPVNASRNTSSVQNGNTSSANVHTNSNTNVSVGNGNASTVSTPAVPDSVDTDHDLLTDSEEQLYGTRLSRSDSDADGFSDGEEVKNLYDPLGSGKLSTSPQIDMYKNIPFSYSVLYPVGFKAEAVDTSNETVLFTSSTGEFIEVLVFENKDKITPRQWYISQFQDKATPQDLVNKTGLKGVLAVDSSTVYFGNEEYIYGLSYHIGTKNEQSFGTTFAMMYESFTLLGDTITTPTSNKNSNSNKNSSSQNSNKNKNSNTNSSTNK